MGTVNQLLTLAEQQLGNGGAKYWNWFRDNYAPTWGGYVDGDATPYCACFDTWLLDKTDTPCVFFPRAYAFDWREVAESDRIGKYDLKPGDMISFDWDDDWRGDHVGVVKSVQQWGVVTYEGNTGSEMRVQERQRLWSVILFGIRPEYESEDDMTEADFQRIQKMIDENNKKVGWWVWSYKYKPVNGDKDAYWLLTNAPWRVWSYKYKPVNGDKDAYALLTEARNALAPVGDALASIGEAMAKVCAALGIKQ